jgi:decaprenylphospho-beta-D-erythro-pentofuranosid-2-ulose 2-reductase
VGIVNDSMGLPQSVLVLGGGSDIARALVRSLIQTRARTIVLGGRPGSTSLALAADEARQSGASTVGVVHFDALDPGSVAAAVDEAFGTYGDIDLVVVAFGVLGDQMRAEADPLAAIEVATVNYTAAVTAGLAAARHLRAQGHGTLLALSTVAGERVRRANFVYGSSKAGMDGFYQGLGDALAGSGARVVIVRPGFVRTAMTAGMDPAPFATDADTVAAAVVAGLAKGSGIIWVPSLLRAVFVVFRHLPRAIWRKIPG